MAQSTAQQTGGSSSGLIETMNQIMGSIAYTPQTTTLGGTPSSTTSGGGSAGDTALSIASTVLTSGLGIVPLIGGLIGLFGGGGQSTEPTLTRYTMPDPVSFQGAETRAGIQYTDSDQTGMPRVTGVGSGSSGSGATNGSGGQSAGSGGSQITVNVQAMDARSFLDRSNDIAAAVRDAMLNLNSINDVVTNL